MQFNLQHRRDVVGNRIGVLVVAEADQRILSVATDLDDFSLGNDAVPPPAVQYEREFRQAGDASPGRQHLLRVTATDQGGQATAAEHRWEDES